MTLTGLGTITNAMDLQTALNWDWIDPGETVYLRGGTYHGDFTCTLVGTAENPITIRPYQDEHVIIDGSLTVNGDFCCFRDMEIMYSGWTRETQIAGSAPEDIPFSGFLNQGQDNLYLNLVIHDVKVVGFFNDSGAVSSEMHGCVIYYVGWSGPDRGHGHGIYLQNIGDVVRYVRGCVIHDNFGFGIHAYTQSPDTLKHLWIEGVTSYRNGSLYGAQYNNVLVGGWGANDDLYDLTMRDVRGYGSNGMSIGYNSGGDLVELTNTYSPDGLSKNGLTNLTETNSYTGPAIGNQVFVYVDLHTAGKGIITIYNQAESESIEVDVSSIISEGDNYTLRNTQDYFNDVISGTLGASETIVIDMRAARHSVAAPVLWDAPASCFPVFGAFVLIKEV